MRPRPRVLAALLQRIVLNLMALHRNVSRRGETKRAVPCGDLAATVVAVLLGATEADLAGLRWPSSPARRARGHTGQPEPGSATTTRNGAEDIRKPREAADLSTARSASST